MVGISPTGVEDLDLVLLLTFGWEWSGQPRFDPLFYTGTPEHKISNEICWVCPKKKRREKQIKKGKEKIREKEGKREKGERRKEENSLRMVRTLTERTGLGGAVRVKTRPELFTYRLGP